MELNTNPMTAQIPSGFGVPSCGHAVSVKGASLGTASTVTVVRERQATVCTGDMGDLGLPPYIRGTSAWSPPTS